MSQAIKEVGAVGRLLAKSNLSRSPIWNKPVEKVVPAQLHSFSTRLAMQGRADEARAELNLLLSELTQATLNGEVEALHLIGITDAKPLTAGQLVAGLSEMSQPRPAAILFALESGLDLEKTVSLRWSQAVMLRDTLNQMASAILRLQPRHLWCDYVFWQGNRPLPLFGLETDVYDAFGMTWVEFELAYSRLVPYAEVSTE